MFPVIFIFHDMEEIVGYIPWLERNKSLIKGKYPTEHDDVGVAFNPEDRVFKLMQK